MKPHLCTGVNKFPNNIVKLKKRYVIKYVIRYVHMFYMNIYKYVFPYIHIKSLEKSTRNLTKNWTSGGPILQPHALCSSHPAFCSPPQTFHAQAFVLVVLSPQSLKWPSLTIVHTEVPASTAGVPWGSTSSTVLPHKKIPGLLPTKSS